MQSFRPYRRPIEARILVSTIQWKKKIVVNTNQNSTHMCTPMRVPPEHQHDWDEMAAVDPMWAVLTYAEKKGSWSEDEFFLHGETEIAGLMRTLQSLEYPKRFEMALDFGCGVGRLTRALVPRFHRVHGIDVSEVMIKEARLFTPSASFLVNHTTRLPFPDNSFDLVYSRIVLQHLPSRTMIREYVGEFLRVVRRGGIAVFQFPTHISLLHRVQPRRRLYSLLRRVGVSPMRLWQANLTPMRMIAIPEQKIDDLVAAAKCVTLRIDRQRTEENHRSSTYYVAKT